MRNLFQTDSKQTESQIILPKATESQLEYGTCADYKKPDMLLYSTKSNSTADSSGKLRVRRRQKSRDTSCESPSSQPASSPSVRSVSPLVLSAGQATPSCQQHHSKVNSDIERLLAEQKRLKQKKVSHCTSMGSTSLYQNIKRRFGKCFRLRLIHLHGRRGY